MMCDATRHALSADDPGPVELAHLAECAACRQWAETLAAVRRTVPELVPAAPEGFAERLAAGVQAHARDASAGAGAAAAGAADGAGAGPGDPGSQAHKPRLPWAMGMPAAAALVALVVAVAAVLTQGAGDGGDSDGAAGDVPGTQVLAAAVEPLAEPGTGYRFTVDGSTEIDWSTRPADDGDPPAGRTELPELLDRFEELVLPEPVDVFPPPSREELVPPIRNFDELRGRMEELGGTLDELRSGVREELRAEIREELERAREQLRDRQAILGASRLHITYEGAGTVDGDGNVRATISSRLHEPFAREETVEMLQHDGVTYVRRAGDEVWIALDGDARFRFFGVDEAEDLRTVLELVADAGPVSTLEAIERDGVTLRRFRIAPQVRADVQADVDIDDAGVLRRVEMSTAFDRGGADVAARFTVTFDDIGAGIVVDPPQRSIPLREAPPESIPGTRLGLGITIHTDAQGEAGGTR